MNLTYLTLKFDSWNYVEMFYAFSLVFSSSFQIYLYIKSLDSEFMVVFKRALIINFINDEYQKSALNSNIAFKSSNLNVYHNIIQTYCIFVSIVYLIQCFFAFQRFVNIPQEIFRVLYHLLCIAKTVFSLFSGPAIVSQRS